ncbi:hypothetical protein [Paenibacillus sp. FSL H8-0048]|uniref:hypothetical protein n=1 Tax=Paenibacillus sp. FSL H8-0048 TaxID=2954508 RepID=UPI004040B01F
MGDSLFVFFILLFLYNCGGTHLKKIGEVGEMKLKRNNIGRGKERIEIYLCE